MADEATRARRRGEDRIRNVSGHRALPVRAALSARKHPCASWRDPSTPGRRPSEPTPPALLVRARDPCPRPGSPPSCRTGPRCASSRSGGRRRRDRCPDEVDDETIPMIRSVQRNGCSRVVLVTTRIDDARSRRGGRGGSQRVAAAERGDADGARGRGPSRGRRRRKRSAGSPRAAAAPGGAAATAGARAARPQLYGSLRSARSTSSVSSRTASIRARSRTVCRTPSARSRT